MRNIDTERKNELSVPYQVYSDLGKIYPESVKTEEDEENYEKSLLYGCKNCDLISTRMRVTTHFCSNNGKSKYEQHMMKAFNRKIEKLGSKKKEDEDKTGG